MILCIIGVILIIIIVLSVFATVFDIDVLNTVCVSLLIIGVLSIGAIVAVDTTEISTKECDNQYDSISEVCYKSYDILPLDIVEGEDKDSSSAEQPIIFVRKTIDEGNKAYKIIISIDDKHEAVIIKEEDVIIKYIASGETPYMDYWKRTKVIDTILFDGKRTSYFYILHIPENSMIE